MVIQKSNGTDDGSTSYSSKVGRICWKGTLVDFESGVKEWRVMDDESGDDERDRLTNKWGGESRQDWWGWWNESGSWFQRRGSTYLNERSVIFKEMVGGRERVTTDEEQVLRGDWRDKVVKIGKLSGCKNFVSLYFMCLSTFSQWRDLRLEAICVDLGALKVYSGQKNELAKTILAV